MIPFKGLAPPLKLTIEDHSILRQRLLRFPCQQRVIDQAVCMSSGPKGSQPSIKRRALLRRIVNGFSLVGLGLLAYPFIRHWVPAWRSEGSREVDLSELKQGETLSVSWLGREVKILKRTVTQLQMLSKDSDSLKDPSSAASNQPSFATGRLRAEREDFFVFYAECTHLGCAVSVRAGNEEPIYCPCHQSTFDAAGRVTKGSAAKANLDVPNYRHISANAILLLEPEPEERVNS